MINEKVLDWMSRTVLTVKADQTLPEAHALMKEYNVRRLPVLQADKLVGIVTLGDLREASPSDATSLSIFELNYLLARLRIEDIMTRNPLTVTPDTRLVEAAKMMLHHKVGGLPVMENGVLVGIITETDIFRAYVHLAEELTNEVAA